MKLSFIHLTPGLFNILKFVLMLKISDHFRKKFCLKKRIIMIEHFSVWFFKQIHSWIKVTDFHFWCWNNNFRFNHRLPKYRCKLVKSCDLIDKWKMKIKRELGRSRGYIAYKMEFMLRLVAEYLNRFWKWLNSFVNMDSWFLTLW